MRSLGESKMTDTEIAVISPEGLEIAHAYLINKSDTEATAKHLGIPVEEVHRFLSKREVSSYIDRIFNESGFRNREKMGAVWDEVLATKLEEMDETGMGSGKDIVEILEKMHKFNMDQMAMQIKLLDAQKAAGPAIQVNTQNNYGDNYNKLLEKLIGN
jgi:hypothetical protein